MSLEELNIRESTETEIAMTNELTGAQPEETEEEKARRNREAAATLFGGNENVLEASLVMMSSPLVDPMHAHPISERMSKREGTVDVEMRDSVSALSESGLTTGWYARDPESIELEELDDLLGGF